MPTTTPNLGLTKDYEGEPYSLARINANSDRIDTFAGEALTDTVYDTTGTPALIKKRKIAGVETPVTIETPDTTPTEGSKHLITSDAVHAALASKQEELSQSQLAAVNSGITAEKLTADEAALAEVVDAGAKNLSSVSSGIISNSGGGFPIQTTPITIPIGTYIVSFKFSGNATRGSVQFRSGSTTIDSLAFDMAPSMSIQIEITSDTIDNFNLYSNSTATISEFMICTLADWNVSQKYVPYCPSMAEMYEMILALQNGTRSAPALAKAEPEEIKEPETGEEETR